MTRQTVIAWRARYGVGGIEALADLRRSGGCRLSTSLSMLWTNLETLRWPRAAAWTPPGAGAGLGPWMAADDAYGNNTGLWSGLREPRLGYVLAVSRDHLLPFDGGKIRDLFGVGGRQLLDTAGLDGPYRARAHARLRSKPSRRSRPRPAGSSHPGPAPPNAGAVTPPTALAFRKRTSGTRCTRPSTTGAPAPSLDDTPGHSLIPHPQPYPRAAITGPSNQPKPQSIQPRRTRPALLPSWMTQKRGPRRSE